MRSGSWAGNEVLHPLHDPVPIAVQNNAGLHADALERQVATLHIRHIDPRGFAWKQYGSTIVRAIGQRALRGLPEQGYIGNIFEPERKDFALTHRSVVEENRHRMFGSVFPHYPEEGPGNLICSALVVTQIQEEFGGSK